MIDTSMPVWPIPFNLDGFVSWISASERVTLALRLCVGAILLIFLGGTPAGAQENYQETLRKAEQGDGDAQASLGFMFAEGRDGEQDRAEAVRWFRLAAEQGNANGQAGLGVSYFDGEGVAQDTAVTCSPIFGPIDVRKFSVMDLPPSPGQPDNVAARER